MTSEKIGRLTLLKYVLISVMSIMTILTTFALIYGQDTDVPITLKRILDTFVDEFLDNINFIYIQTVLQLIAIWFLGGQIGRLIIEKEKNIYLVGGLTFLTLWILLLIGAMLTSGLMNSIKYGGQGFTSAITGWIIYGLIPFLIFGIVHGTAMGYILGNEIKNRGRRINGLQQ